jgi:hypothetical protein
MLCKAKHQEGCIKPEVIYYLSCATLKLDLTFGVVGLHTEFGQNHLRLADTGRGTDRHTNRYDETNLIFDPVTNASHWVGPKTTNLKQGAMSTVQFSLTMFH